MISSHRKISFILFIFICLLSLLLFFSSCRLFSNQSQSSESVATPTATVPPTPTATPIPYAEYQLKNGDTVYSVFMEMGIESSSIYHLLEESKETYNLADVTAGKTISYRLEDGEISEILYPVDDERQFVVCKSENGEYACSIKELPFEIRPQVYQGTIETSLWDSAINAGLDPNTLMALAGIYDWEIDFNTEFRKNDSFEMLVEKKYLDGEFHHFGQILAANIIVEEKEHPAFFFLDPEGRTDYYDLEGNCLRKTWLKAPLQFSRISSGFSSSRRHPILKIVRPHWGVDYAAPAGTPVRAIADGRITFAGTKGGYGRYIHMKHGSSPYETGYGHLKGFARGIKKNNKVKQGQIIGYVGSTGLSTGPHLDFRVYYYGKPINPLKVKKEPARKVSEEFRKDFLQIIHSCVSQFPKPTFTAKLHVSEADKPELEE